jgi:hypothetical protein
MGNLSKNVVIATCFNAYENTENPTVDFIKELLEEDLPKPIVEDNSKMIESCLAYVRGEVEFRQLVFDKLRGMCYDMSQKGEILREMSKHFPKSQMRKVHNTIYKS